MNLIYWIKSHKVQSLLLALFLFLIFKDQISQMFYAFQYRNSAKMYDSYGGVGSVADLRSTSLSSPSYPSVPSFSRESVDVSATDRKVIEESSLSLQVKDVPASQKSIKAKAESLGGFMVNSSLSRPEEAASGNITIRVPSEKSAEMLDFLRAQSVKVVSENLTGYDVTERYSDLEAKITTLTTTKNRFNEIMNKAEKVEDILNVQREIINLQDQIDSYKGQLDYLAKTSSSVKMTVYLATDEFSLPYAPATSWRPNVIFKQAVRSLVLDLRGLGGKIIWVVVYAPIWLLVLLVFLIVKRKFFSGKK